MSKSLKVTAMSLPMLSFALAGPAFAAEPLMPAASAPVAVNTINKPEAPTCTVTAHGGDDLSGEHPEGKISAENNAVTGVVDVTGPENCGVDVTITSWTAPNGYDGKPYDQQRQFTTATEHFGPGTHEITTLLPTCYYQADLVRGNEPAGYDGGPIYQDGRMMASLHGGTEACPGSGGGAVTPTEPAPTPPPVPAPTTNPAPAPVSNPGQGSSVPQVQAAPTAPASIQSPSSTPATLPQTGSSDLELVIAGFAAGLSALTRRLKTKITL